MQEKHFFFNFKAREIESLKNMFVQIWLLWKRQVTWTMTCHIKLLPANFPK